MLRDFSRMTDEQLAEALTDVIDYQEHCIAVEDWEGDTLCASEISAITSEQRRRKR